MNEKFLEMLSFYFSNLENLRVRHERKLITDEYFEGAVYYNRRWFQELRTRLKIEEYTTKRQPTEDDLKKYTYGDKPELFPLSHVLEYRGEEIPVFIDDYGQQDFAVFRGKTISGGAYNFFADELFCDHVDGVLEEEILHGDHQRELQFTFIEDLMKGDSEDGKN